MHYLVIDTETTGLDPAQDQIVELAGVWRDATGLPCSWHKLCNPGVSIPPVAMAVHHITNEDVKDAEPLDSIFHQLLSSFRATTGTLPPVYVAHNAAFDRGFLPSSVATASWICTWRCSLHLWPEAPGHGNQVLRYWLNTQPKIPSDLYPHRGLYDAIVTETILREMLKMHPLEHLVHLSQQPVLLRTVRFGKYRGQLWTEVPSDYLRWIVKQSTMDPDVRHTALHTLNS